MSRTLERTGVIGVPNGGFVTALTCPASNHKFEVVAIHGQGDGTAGASLLANLITPLGGLIAVDQPVTGFKYGSMYNTQGLILYANDYLQLAWLGLTAASSLAMVTYVDVEYP